MKCSIFYLIALFLVMGCKPEKRVSSLFSDVVPEHLEKNVQDMDVRDSVTTISVLDCTPEKELKLSSWVDSITYLRLDSRDAALIGRINKFVRKDNAIYLSDKYKTKTIKKFTMSGDFVTDIGRYGEAPGEYAEPTDFVVTDSLVIVYDQFVSRLNYYTLDGRYLLSRKLPFLCHEFHQFSEDNFMFYALDADNRHLPSIENYSIFQTDSAFVIKERGFYRERGKYSSIISDYNFSEMNGKLYYHPLHSGKIYEMSGDGECTLRIHLDFGKKQLPEEFLLDKNWGEYKRESKQDRYHFFPGEFLLVDSLVYFAYAQEHRLYRTFYSLKDGKSAGSSVVRNDVLPIFPFSNIIGADKNCIVGYVYPNDIIVGRDHYDAERYTQIVGETSANIAKQLNEEDNPILIWFHMKS